MDQTLGLQLPYLLPNKGQKQVTLNEALNALDVLVQLAVASRAERAPPRQLVHSRGWRHGRLVRHCGQGDGLSGRRLGVA
ncbi:MAG: hypothetical protein ABJL57_03065 [Hyphomonas sp.]|uniref:hypothetical protein n=1 Tax=Hyphomonas sp. TaxID=87 RepID=UPI0032674202